MPQNKIGPVPPHNPNAPQDGLPGDEQEIDVALRARIIKAWSDIPHLLEYVKIEAVERFPDTDEEDLTVSTVPDPIVPTKARTSIIQIGIPTVEEFERTNDLHTQLNFVYPITFDLEVVDRWDNSNNALFYPNSTKLFMAVYMSCRLAIKRNRTLGFKAVATDYLQMVNASSVEVEETEGRLHTGDWSLTVKCTDVLC